MKSRKKKRSSRQLGSIERDVLTELTAGDMLYGFLLSARSSRIMFKVARERAQRRYRDKCAVNRLTDKGLIRIRDERLSITPAGKRALGIAADQTFSLLQKQKKTWDHKWRIVAFDIPEKHAHLRNRVRDLLKRAGFVKVQHSVWIFPHECPDFVQFVKDETKMAPHILYGVLERVEGEKRLRKIFKL
ncbi:MAG: CRISPR-associated endonuclease Cas2 [bacterium]|nr:CRISPR-associated endonuclease Cas2 [bacterium]